MPPRLPPPHPPSLPPACLTCCSFPERLCTIYLLDAGPLFRSLYYLVEPFIDA